MRWELIPLPLAFIIAGLLFAHPLGIEADEALLANGIYPHAEPVYSWKFGSFKVPIMLMENYAADWEWARKSN